MMRRLAIFLILILVAPTLACQLVTGRASPTPIPPVNMEPTQKFVPPTPFVEPTETQAEEPTVEEPTVEIAPTIVEAPTEAQAPTPLPLVPTATTGEAGLSGVIESVTLASGTQGNEKSPVDPTNVFPIDAVIHAVVHLKNAPANTTVMATWYVVDVGPAAESNSKIDTTQITTEGSRYIDFSLSPQPKWPAGSYKVEIGLNGQTVQTLPYTVK